MIPHDWNHTKKALPLSPGKLRVPLLVLLLISCLLCAFAGCGMRQRRIVSIGTPVRIEIRQTEDSDGNSCVKHVSVQDGALVSEIATAMLSTFESERVNGSVPFAPSVSLQFFDKNGAVMTVETDYKIRFGRIPKTSIAWQLPSSAPDAVFNALESTPCEPDNVHSSAEE